MSQFEILFSLFGLVLGFSLVEILSGLVRATRNETRSASQLYLTCALGVLVSLDLITFWTVLYRSRDLLTVTTLILYAGFFITAVYYWAASLIFPAENERTADLDPHYMAVRRRVMGAVIFCNYGTYGGIWAASGRPPDPIDWVEIGIFTILFVGVIATKSKRASAAALTVTLAAYLTSAILRAAVTG
jgi:hypothetical protein